MQNSFNFDTVKTDIVPNKDEPRPSTSGDGATSQSEHESPYTMTEDILRKRLRSKNKGRYITQLFAAITGT